MKNNLRYKETDQRNTSLIQNFYTRIPAVNVDDRAESTFMNILVIDNDLDPTVILC